MLILEDSLDCLVQSAPLWLNPLMRVEVVMIQSVAQEVRQFRDGPVLFSMSQFLIFLNSISKRPLTFCLFV